MSSQIYGQIPDFNKKISTVRSRGLVFIPIMQNLGQLENRYPNGLSDEIIGNADTKISTGIADTLTASFFSDIIGVSTAETMSIRKENSLEGDLEYGQKNISKVQRKLLNIDEIMRLSTSRLIVCLRGQKPLILDKIMYTVHPLSKNLKDSSISEYNPIWTKNNPKQVVIKQEKKQVQKHIKEVNKKNNEDDENDWNHF